MYKARRGGARLKPAVIVLALFSVALLAGCGDTVIDSAKTEDAIQADLEESLHEKIRTVECPSDVKVEAEKTFTCTVDYTDGGQATATLKIRNDDADVSFVRLKPNK
ncbi:MAG: DUF4333 domain-containing protein [Solirubrobacterales bacterium]